MKQTATPRLSPQRSAFALLTLAATRAVGFTAATLTGMAAGSRRARDMMLLAAFFASVSLAGLAVVPQHSIWQAALLVLYTLSFGSFYVLACKTHGRQQRGNKAVGLPAVGLRLSVPAVIGVALVLPSVVGFAIVWHGLDGVPFSLAALLYWSLGWAIILGAQVALFWIARRLWLAAAAAFAAWQARPRPVIDLLEARHVGAINWLSFSPSSERVAALGLGDRTTVWRLSDGRKLADIQVPASSAPNKAVSWLDDRVIVAIGDHGKTLRLWDIDDQQNSRLVDVSGYGRAKRLACCGTGRFVAIVCDAPPAGKNGAAESRVLVADVANEKINVLRTTLKASALAWEQGKLFVLGARLNGEVGLWLERHDVGGQEVRHDTQLSDQSFATYNLSLAAAEGIVGVCLSERRETPGVDTNSIWVFDSATLTLRNKQRYGGAPSIGMAVLRDQARIAMLQQYADGIGITVVNWVSGHLAAVDLPAEFGVHSLARSCDGKIIGVGGEERIALFRADAIR